MGAYVFPADAVSGAPSYTGKMARLTLGASLSKNTARPVGARSGIHPATPDSVFSVSGTTWTVQPHCGVLDTEASATNGPYGYAFDTNQTGSVNAADATNPRWDLLSVQLSDPAAGDGTSTPGVAIVYTAGTAAASPALPATPARSLALAQITVPQSGGGASTATVLAPYLAGASGIVRCRTSAEYPSSPYVGQYVDDATTGLLRWNGSAWVSSPTGAYTAYTPTLTNWILGSGLSDCRWTQIGKTVYVHIFLRCGAGVSFNSSGVAISLPVTASASGSETSSFMTLYTTTALLSAVGKVVAGASTALIYVPTSTANSSLVPLSSTSPFPPNGGNLEGTLIYEAA